MNGQAFGCIPVLGLESRYFRALHRPEAIYFGVFWHLGQGAGQGGWSAREDEPEGGYRIRIRQLGVGRIAAPGIGAVPGRASRDG
ncbi:MAG: hypothetical protein ACREYC_25215 [Gammaproteobacteria bacterium]